MEFEKDFDLMKEIADWGLTGCAVCKHYKRAGKDYSCYNPKSKHYQKGHKLFANCKFCEV